MRYLFLSVVLLLPGVVMATTRLNPNVAQTYTGTTLNIGNVTQGPDGLVTTLQGSGSSFIAGFGEDLTSGQVHVALSSDPSETVQVGVEWLDLITVNHTETITLNGTDNDVSIGPADGIVFDRLRLILESGTVAYIDAVWVEQGDAEDPPITPGDPVDPSDTTPDPVVPDTTPDSTEPDTSSDTSQPNTTDPSSNTDSQDTASVTVVRLVKLFSDGDPSTQYDTAVYAVDELGRRYPFSQEAIYFSWFEDFDDVEEVTSQELATLPLERPMPMHQGSWLIKIQSTSDVYAVSQGGRLWRIPDETTAQTLYGTGWQQRVRDIPVTDWPHYTVAGEITDDTYPDDTLVRDANFMIWLIRDGRRSILPEADLSLHAVQSRDVIHATEVEADLSLYPIDGVYSQSDDIRWLDL